MKKDIKIRKSNKRLVIVALLFLVLGISIGYAAMSSSLNINGTSKIKGHKWDVHFESLNNITKIGQASDSDVGEFAARIVELETTPSDKTDDTTVNFAISLKQPGDKYQFQVNVVNDGSIDANARLTVTPVSSPANQYINWNVTGISETGERINAGASKTITVAIEYDSNVETIVGDDLIVNLSAVVSAEQAY